MNNLGQASLAAVKQYLRLAQAEGINPEQLLEDSNLSASLLHEDSGRISGEEFQTLLTKLVEVLPSPILGLLSGDHVQPSSYSVLGYIIMSCNNFAEALTQIAPYEKLVGDMGSTQVLSQGDEIHIHWHCIYPQANVRMHMVDNVFASWINFSIWLGNEADKRALRVELERPAPATQYLAEYAKRWNCPVLFDQPHNCIAIHKSLLDTPIRKGTPELKPALEQHAKTQLEQLTEAPSFKQQVTNSIRQHMPLGVIVNQESVAQKLNTSVRTMQRKLKEEGSSYQQIFDNERRIRAEFLLKHSQCSLVEISQQLGYTEASSFSRSFKVWTGMTPGEFREKC